MKLLSQPGPLVKLIFTVFALFGIGHSIAYSLPGPDQLFNKGNEAYSQQDFASAIDYYQQCLQIAESAPLHYNLANAYHETDEIGRAVLHYEKSLVLEPANPDAAANLNFVREAAELAAPTNGLVTRLGKKLSVNYWGWIALGGFWISLALILLPRLYGGQRALSRLLLVAALGVTATSAVALYGYHQISQDGVILQNDTPLRVAPSPQSNEYGYLQAGEIITIQKEHQSYIFIDNQNDKSGWVLSTEVGRIWE